MAANPQSATLLLTTPRSNNAFQLNKLLIELVQCDLNVFNCLNINRQTQGWYQRLIEIGSNYSWLVEVDFIPLGDTDVYIIENYTLDTTDGWQLGAHLAHQGNKVTIYVTSSFTPILTFIHQHKRVVCVKINSQLSLDQQIKIFKSIAVGLNRLVNGRCYDLHHHIPLEIEQDLFVDLRAQQGQLECKYSYFESDNNIS